MRIAAIFRDKPEMMAHRAKNENAHLSYLKTNAAEILIGGGLRRKPGDIFAGGLWVMEVASFERAEELIRNDPYYVAELRGYDLFVWGKAIDAPVVL